MENSSEKQYLPTRDCQVVTLGSDPMHPCIYTRRELRQSMVNSLRNGMAHAFNGQKSELSELETPFDIDFRGVDFRGLDVRGVDFSGLDLTGANFRDAVLPDSDFTGADLTDVNFDHATLTGVKGFTVQQLKRAESLFQLITDSTDVKGVIREAVRNRLLGTIESTQEQLNSA